MLDGVRDLLVERLAEDAMLARLLEASETVAVKVFADNLRDLLLAAPAGKRVVLGLDPGIRTGVKVAVVSDTGKVLATHTVYPHEPRRDWEGSLHALSQLVAQHGVSLIAIGNGTASRKTDRLAADLIRRVPSRVSGLSPAVAASVVRWRDAHGAFRHRRQLLIVSGLGPKSFEQSAGFLRIRGGDDPLDMTGGHPETYPVVQKLLAATARVRCRG